MSFIQLQYRRAKKNILYTILLLFIFSIGFSLFYSSWNYFYYESNFDEFIENSDQVYRLVSSSKLNQKKYGRSSPEIVNIIRDNVPEVNSITNFRYLYGRSVEIENQKRILKNFILVDSAFSKVFVSNKFKKLQYIKPGNIYFSDKEADILGFNEDQFEVKLILTGNKEKLLKYGGAFGEIPGNSNLSINALGFLSDLDVRSIGKLSGFNMTDVNVYLRLKDGVEKSQAEAKINSIINEKTNDEYKYNIILQELKDIHTNNDVLWNTAPQVNKKLLVSCLFGGIILLVLLTTNYTLHSLNQIITRKNEIIIRKVLGASNSTILKSIIAEAFLFFMFVILIMTVSHFYLYKYGIYKHTMQFSAFGISPVFSIFILLIAFLLISISTGGLTYIIVHKKNTFNSVRYKTNGGVKVNYILGLQSFVFIVLLFASFSFIKQLQFIQSNSTLGFIKEDCISITLPDRDIASKYSVLKEELISFNGITAVSASNVSSPVYSARMAGFKSYTDEKTGKKRGYMKTGAFTDDELIEYDTYTYMDVDYDFIETMGLNLIQGKGFNINEGSDGIIVNEEYIKRKQIKNPLRNKHRLIDEDVKILGVVENFYNNNVKSKVYPHVLSINSRNSRLRQVIVRFENDRKKEVLNYIAMVWEKVTKDNRFEYFFTEDQVNEEFKSDREFAKFLLWMVGITLMITFFGIISFLVYSTNSNLKQISIHKIMGANNWGIMKYLLKEYFYSTSIAVILGFITSYFLMQIWTRNNINVSKMTLMHFLFPLIIFIFLISLGLLIKFFKIKRLNLIDVLKE